MLRLYVTYTIPDSRAKVKKNQFEALGLQNKLGEVYLAECYTIDSKLNPKQIQTAKNLLANPLAQSADTALSSPRNFNFVVEIGYLPGVTDNVGATAKETLSDGAGVKFKDGENMYFSAMYFVCFDSKRSAPIYGRSRSPINRPRLAPSETGRHATLKPWFGFLSRPEKSIRQNSLWRPP